MDRVKTMESARILRDAAGLVRRGWTSGALARDTDFEAVYPTQATACQWCAVGAIVAADDAPYGAEFPETPGGVGALLRLWQYLGYLTADVLANVMADVIDWNDVYGRTKEEVAAAMEAAADKADAEAAALEA